MAKSYASASAVVLAEVMAAHRSAGSREPGGEYAEEVVTFKVLYSWKGRFDVGSTVTLRTFIGPGSCGHSIEQGIKWPDDLLVAKALPTGSIWTLYILGAQDFELASPSKRIGNGGERDLKELFQLEGR